MSEYKKILILENEIEAKLMGEILKDKNIPHIIQSYGSAAFDGLFQRDWGWGHIESEIKYSNEIISTYKDLKSQEKQDE